MDALAGLAFGVTVVTAVHGMGQKNAKSVSKVVAKSGLLAIGFIYLLLILMGAMSLGRFKVSDNGGVAFNQIVNVYGGVFGQALLAFLLTVTCLATAISLVAAFAQDFHKHFPKVSYHAWLALSCLASFLAANFGLAVASVRNHLPLANMGLSWLVPALVGLAIGFVVHFVKNKRVASTLEED